MKRKRMSGKRLAQAPSFPQIVLLAFAFFVGILLGQVLGLQIPSAVVSQLREYVEACRQLLPQVWKKGTWSSVLFLMYVRFPAFAFLCGFTTVGLLLLPCAAALYGFLLSYSICCLTAAFGLPGIGLALALLGIRALMTVPCFFLLASTAWETAQAKLQSSSRERTAATRYKKDNWLRFLICLVILLFGTWMELMIGPDFLRFALKFI